MKLSIIIPVYNEVGTLLNLLKKVKSVDLGDIEKEILLIDDFSTDGTRELIRTIKDKEIKTIFNKKNLGKGGAVKAGIKNASGDIIIIQDADLEYNPEEYPQLIAPIIRGKFSVVYGSRSLNKKNNYSHLSFFIGGKTVTLLTNLLFFSRLTDEPTCYKVFKSDLIKSIKINSNRFNWEPEVTAKILKKGIKIHEIPITYNPRKKAQGKKINWKDGISALFTLVKYRISD